MDRAAKDAAMLLSANLVASSLCQRDVESRLANGAVTVGQSGGTVNVKIRPILTATLDEATAGKKTLEKEDNTQTSVLIDATNYVHVRQDLTTKEETYEIDDFVSEIIAPAANALATQVDIFFLKRFSGGFAENMSGSAGTAPSTVAHILTGRKTLMDNLAPIGGRVFIIGTTAEKSFLALDNFASSDYGDDGPTAIKEARLARRYGLDIFVDQNIGVHAFGDSAGTVLLDGAGTAGDTTVGMDAFTASTGTLRKGARFTIAGTSTIYTVTEDTAIASNEATAIPITPVLSANESDNDAITFKTAHTQDMMYVKNAAAGAIVAPAPLRGIASAVGTYDGVSARLTIASSIDGSSGAIDDVLLDVFVGANVLRPEMGTITQG